jgi:hypothetical protein
MALSKTKKGLLEKRLGEFEINIEHGKKYSREDLNL